MDVLKSKSLLHRRKRRRKHKSKVRQFYSDFNSASSSSSEDGIRKGAESDDPSQHFRTASPKTPKMGPDIDIHLGNDNADKSLSSSRSNFDELFIAIPLSPGVTKNQELKDKAYEYIFQNKIKVLRSMVSMPFSHPLFVS